MTPSSEGQWIDFIVYLNIAQLKDRQLFLMLCNRNCVDNWVCCHISMIKNYEQDIHMLCNCSWELTLEVLKTDESYNYSGVFKLMTGFYCGKHFAKEILHRDE